MNRALKSKFRSEFEINVKTGIKIVSVIVLSPIVVVSLIGCSSKAIKNADKAKAKDKNDKQTESGSASSSDSDSDSEASSSSDTKDNKDKDKATDKSKDKTKDKKSGSSSGSSASSSGSAQTQAKQKVWVPEQGHYEERKVLKCRCGQKFSSMAAQQAHRNAYIAEKRKTNPSFE